MRVTTELPRDTGLHARSPQKLATSPNKNPMLMSSKTTLAKSLVTEVEGVKVERLQEFKQTYVSNIQQETKQPTFFEKMQTGAVSIIESSGAMYTMGLSLFAALGLSVS